MGRPKRLGVAVPTNWSNLLAVLGMVLIGIAGCKRERGPQPGEVDQQQVQDAHALHRMELASCADTLVSLTGASDDAVEMMLKEVFLYHDKQKVILRDPDRYGAMACAAALGNIAEPSYFPVNEIVPVAKVHVEDGELPDWPYQRGVTCVYMRRKPPGFTAFTKHVPSLPDEAQCPIPLSQPYETHDVNVSPPSGEIPRVPAVRWDFDVNTRVMYLGVACGPRWCTLGVKTGSQPTPNPTQPSNPKERLKGWYDEQHLAYKPDMTSNVLVPSALSARLIPHPNLENWWQEVPIDTTERHAATIRIPRSLPDAARTPLRHYEQHWWRLPLGTVQADDSIQIHLKLKSETAGSARYVLWRNDSAIAQSDTPLIVERYRDPRPLIEMLRPKLLAYAPPGTARWGWSEKDESAWVRCGYGCCRVSDAVF